MPDRNRIKDISDVRRLPRIGKIRKGIMVGSGKSKHPKEVEYFVCPPEVQAVYGEKPTELDVMLPLDDPTVVFPQAYKLYGGNQRLKCKGDGETATSWSEDGSVEISCPCEQLEEGQCSQRANLMVILPKVSMGGCYQIDTGGINDIIAINSYIANDGFLRGLAGRIAMVPFRLKRIEVKRDDGTGKMMPHWDIQPEFQGNIDVVNALRGDATRVIATVETKQIEAAREDGAESDSKAEEKEPPWEWTPKTHKKRLTTIWAIYSHSKWSREDIKKEMSTLYSVEASDDLSEQQVNEWLAHAKKWAVNQLGN